MNKLTRKQQEENHAALSRARQQERLLREWSYTNKILTVDKETSCAIMNINSTIKKYPLTKTEFDTLINLKTQATKKQNHILNIEIFKTTKILKRKYQRLKRTTNKG